MCVGGYCGYSVLYVTPPPSTLPPSCPKVYQSTLLQQVFVVEYIVHYNMCEECQRREAQDFWRAVVQLRQKVLLLFMNYLHLVPPLPVFFFFSLSICTYMYAPHSFGYFCNVTTTPCDQVSVPCSIRLNTRRPSSIWSS